MKDEIKEILDFIKTLVRENKESDVPLKACVIPFETLYKIEDYITNLQQELNNQIEIVNNRYVEITKLKEENERLKELKEGK